MSELEYPNLRGREKRKKVDDDYRKQISDNLGDGKIFDNHYSWVDSDLGHYSRTFSRELKDFLDLTNYLKARFNKKINCLDIGGIGDSLFGGIYEELKSKIGVPIFGTKQTSLDLGKSLGISLHHASRKEKIDEWQHRSIIGDAYSSESVEETKKYFGTEGVDFIISRMGRGLEFAPENPFKLYEAIKNYYEILNVGGTMLLQLPARHQKIIVAWVNFLKRNYPHLVIKFNSPNHFGYDPSLDGDYTLTIMIEKNEKSPTVLPPLSKFATFRLKSEL
jgi:hypothetical protein